MGILTLVGIIFGLLIILLIIVVAYLRITNEGDYITPEINLEVTSKAFQDKGKISKKCTGRCEDISPPLKLGSMDPEAKTIAVIMDDLDHPIGMYNHWLIWNIPANYDEIPEGIPKKEKLPSLGNAVQGKSHYGGKNFYRGPKPPFGSHEYEFKVYVLDTEVDLSPDARKWDLQKAIERHIVQYGTLKGKFE
ncbi:MAG: YbhB/YbcL family Raf kinase inhibitor-like protein [Thermoplasmatota archaeon]